MVLAQSTFPSAMPKSFGIAGGTRRANARADDLAGAWSGSRLKTPSNCRLRILNLRHHGLESLEPVLTFGHT